MILAVDDDDIVLQLLTKSLSAIGFVVDACNNAAEALNRAAAEDPQLVISDIVMPEMNGFEFRDVYRRKFPHRQTPFVFLSSLSDPDTVVKGLGMGVDDYLVKPVHPEVIKAKVRSIVNRKRRYESQIFHGDIAKFPFVKIMQFCELKGLTGVVDLFGGGQRAHLRFKAGNLDLDNTEEGDTDIEKIYDLAEGTFTITVQPIDYEQLKDAALVPDMPRSAPMADIEKPMGKLSGIKVGTRLFQVQTEFVTYPENQVYSIVILDGKVVLKRSVSTDATQDKADLTKIIEAQHLKVENEVREKLHDAVSKKADTEESPKEKFDRLFEAGYEKYQQRDYAAALTVWEEARAINPTDKTLEINLSIVKKKISA